MPSAASASVREVPQIIPTSRSDMRAFLIAQLHWERYRASRILLVHVLAVSAACVWVPIPVWLRAPMAAACAVCFLGAIVAGLLEWRWGRERDRRAGALDRCQS